MRNIVATFGRPGYPTALAVGAAWFLGIALAAAISALGAASVGDAATLIGAAALASAAVGLSWKYGRDYERLDGEDVLRVVLAQRAARRWNEDVSDLRKAA